MLLKLLPCIVREALLSPNFVRTPEPEMLMEDDDGVKAYDREGQDGVLLGVYYYHIAQMCGVIRPGDTVIDLGCGPCNLLIKLADLNPRAKFLGIDLSKGMLEIAKDKIRDSGLDNITLMNDDISNISSIPAESADVIISSMCLHHLPTREVLEKTLAEMSRILKPQGKVYLYDFGKVKRTETIEFFLSTVKNGYVEEDYRNSLYAAFSLGDFNEVTQKYFGSRLSVYSTKLSPVIIVIKSDSHQVTSEQKEKIALQIDRLNKQQKNDFKQLKLFLSWNGLRFNL
jgi:arsenite methyltransferase